MQPCQRYWLPISVKRKGFTLIEIVMVIGLLGLCSVAATRLYVQGVMSATSQQDHADALWQARLALQRLAMDVRGLRTISTATSNQLTFVDSSANNISYSLSGSNLVCNSQTLANGVNSVSFAYYDKDGSTTATIANIRYIQITLSITKNNTNFSMTTSIYPRALIV